MTPKTEQAEHTKAVLFRELPLGARFSYIGHPDRVYIILERHGYGLICSDESVRGWTTGQQILSADESEELTASLMVVPVSDPGIALNAAREALELAASLRTDQDCPIENHGVVVAAMDALKALGVEQVYYEQLHAGAELKEGDEFRWDGRWRKVEVTSLYKKYAWPVVRYRRAAALAALLPASNTEARCPKCGSAEISDLHHEATFAVPECDYKKCDDCDHQWGHQ